MTTDLEPTPTSLEGVETAPVESVAEELAAGACCSECGAPGVDLENSWCRACGYYPKYGTHVDLDTEDALKPSGGGSEGVPPWAYKFGVVLVAVIALSVAARLILSSFPLLHMIVGMTQLLAGTGVFLTLHFMGFFKRSLQDSGAKLMDMLSPFVIWAPVFQELPKTERKLIIAWTGLCAAFFSVVITGGQPTSWLEFKETVIAQEEEPEGPAGPGGDDLEGAIEDFAEKGTRRVAMPGDEVDGEGDVPAGGDGNDDAEVVATGPEEEEEEEELLETECLIVGYMPGAQATAQPKRDSVADGVNEGAESDEGEESSGTASSDESKNTKEMPAIRALVLASQVSGRLCVVGYVSEGLNVDNSEQLLKRFSKQVRERPFVHCRASAIWLEPKFICNVKYKDWDSQQGMIEPQFDGLLKVLP